VICGLLLISFIAQVTAAASASVSVVNPRFIVLAMGAPVLRLLSQLRSSIHRFLARGDANHKAFVFKSIQQYPDGFSGHYIFPLALFTLTYAEHLGL
jgi:hypothetical protein